MDVNNTWVAIWKGVRAFLISLAVLVLGGMIQALTSFHPEPGLQTYIWTAFGTIIIGALVGLMNWLKNKNAETTVKVTDTSVVTTTVKPIK